MICNFAWRQRKLPDECKKGFIIPLYKGKDCKDECNNYRGISLLSVTGKVFGSILTEILMAVIEGKVSEDQGQFRKGKGCVDQIFVIKMMIEKC